MTLFRFVAAFRDPKRTGMPRKAIDLPRWAGRISRRRGADTVIETDVRVMLQEKYTENRKAPPHQRHFDSKKLSITP